MKQYYAERNGLFNNRLSLSLAELLDCFIQTYRYFYDKNCFELASNGIYETNEWTNEKTQIVSPSMAPSPQVFFNVQMQSQQVWPIYEYIEYYDEATLFTVIEILYDHIAVYDWADNKIEKDEVKAEYAELVNNILRAYKDGFYLVPTSGFIMEQPNQALREQLAYEGDEVPEEIYLKLKSASQNYYRFDADNESKKKAIASLADILENVRTEVKDLFNDEFNTPKNEHDKLIFEIVNGYNIRHNNPRQKTDYSKDVWYDWMMQYDTSTIIAFYKMKCIHS